MNQHKKSSLIQCGSPALSHGKGFLSAGKGAGRQSLRQSHNAVQRSFGITCEIAG